MKFIAVSDMQIPDHDPKAIDILLEYIDGGSWDAVLIVGDELDSPEPSRWNRGMAGEYAGTLQKSIDTCHDVLAQIVDASHGSPVHLMRSNHQGRISTYLNRYAPALASLRALDYSTLLGLGELGITFHDEPWKFTNENGGWYLAHGDEGSLISTSGGTALGLAKNRFGTSTLTGHTHKMGLQHAHSSVNGKITRYVWGFECGHLMSQKKAKYLKAGSANWTQGFGMVIDGHPVPVPIINGKAVVRL